MADRSKRFAGPLALTTSSTLLYTVPSGKVAQVLMINIANESPSSRNVTVRAIADANGNNVIGDVPVTGQSVMVWQGLLVLEAGEKLWAFASAGDVTITISGVES